MAGGAPTSWPGDLDRVLGARDAETIESRMIGFANLLRAVGLAVGTDTTVLAMRAVSRLAAGESVAFFWVLYSLFVSRRSEREIFMQAFGMYWLHNGAVSELLGSAEDGAALRDRQPMFRRLRDALSREPTTSPFQEDPEHVQEMTGTYSNIEVLRHMDFAQMSEAELRRAQREIAKMKMPFEEIVTRRFKSAARGARIDLRRSLHQMAQNGGDLACLKFSRRTERRVPLVALCDISGSMERYSRILIHFLYFLTNDRARVHAFLFGTRLSNITYVLKDRDPDRAIARVSSEVTDWCGGTRIGVSLREFNRNWSRRLLGQNATVLLLTDGLERGDENALEKEVWRLAGRSRRLFWLNPLTGFSQYEPTAAGAEILSRHVDAMLACHNLDSLETLAAGLSRG